MPIDDIDSLRETINELPQGMVLFCCYLQAHIYYLQEEYELSMGVAGTAFHMACARGYQVDAIYLGLMLTGMLAAELLVKNAVMPLSLRHLRISGYGF